MGIDIEEIKANLDMINSFSDLQKIKRKFEALLEKENTEERKILLNEAIKYIEEIETKHKNETSIQEILNTITSFDDLLEIKMMFKELLVKEKIKKYINLQKEAIEHIDKIEKTHLEKILRKNEKRK